MDEPALVLTPATLADSAFFLALRNHPETRRHSFLTDEIAPDVHDKWFRARLGAFGGPVGEGPFVALFVATERGIAVGTGRLDLHPPSPEAEISLTVHWDYQQRGLGTALIEALCQEARALGIRVAVAHIKDSNTGSRIAFGRAGFLIDAIHDGVVTMQRQL